MTGDHPASNAVRDCDSDPQPSGLRWPLSAPRSGEATFPAESGSESEEDDQPTPPPPVQRSATQQPSAVVGSAPCAHRPSGQNLHDSPDSSANASDADAESKVGPPFYSESEQSKLNYDSDHDDNLAINMKEGVEEILDAYDVIVPKNMLPPVSDRLAKTMTDWLRNVPSREKIKECFMAMACLLPENVEGLKTMRINELLYQKLPFRAKANDQRIHDINSYFTQGTGPLIALLDKLIDFEVTIKAQNLTTIQCEDTELKAPGSSLNLTEIRGFLHKSIQILSFGNVTCLQKRKSLIKNYLDQRYHYLTKPSNPVTDELLGPNLEQKITESNKLMEAAQKIYFSGKARKNYFPRVRFSPYTQYRGNKRQNQGSTRQEPGRKRYFTHENKNCHFQQQHNSYRGRGQRYNNSCCHFSRRGRASRR